MAQAAQKPAGRAGMNQVEVSWPFSKIQATFN